VCAAAGGGWQRDLVALAGVVETDWARLKAAYEDRQRKLLDANRSAQFYADATDAADFISENQVRRVVCMLGAALPPILMIGGAGQAVLASFDAARDEESANNMLKKQVAVQADIDSYEFSIKALRTLAQSLIDGNHFDKEAIGRRRVRRPS
jgi:small ligand-binding sensory domain FIST